MIESILLAYELLTVLAPFAIAYLVLGRWHASQGIIGVQPPYSKTAGYRSKYAAPAQAVAPQRAGYEAPKRVHRSFYQHLLFALYIFAVLYVTGSGTLYDALRYGFDLSPMQINLIPFSQDPVIWQCLLNVIMFMPLGFLAAKLWPTTDKLGIMALYGFSLSLLIELSQLLNSRSTDVDDLIMNTIGAILGLLLYRFLFRKSRFERKVFGRRFEQPFAIEPILYFGVMFVGRFLLFDGMGAAMLLLGHRGLPMLMS